MPADTAKVLRLYPPLSFYDAGRNTNLLQINNYRNYYVFPGSGLVVTSYR
jgi:hypothetical protein